MEQHWTEEETMDWLDEIGREEEVYQQNQIKLLIRGLKIKQMTRINSSSLFDFTQVAEYFINIEDYDFEYENYRNTSKEQLILLGTELKKRLAKAFPQNFI